MDRRSHKFRVWSLFLSQLDYKAALIPWWSALIDVARALKVSLMSHDGSSSRQMSQLLLFFTAVWSPFHSSVRQPAFPASGQQLKPRPSLITIKGVICDYTAHFSGTTAKIASRRRRWRRRRRWWKDDVRVIKVRKVPWKQGHRRAN